MPLSRHGQNRGPSRDQEPRTVVRSAKPTSKFKYRQRTEEDVQRQLSRSRSRFDGPFVRGFIQYKADKGDNLVRILPPTWPDADHYSFPVWMHRYVGAESGTYPCPRKMKNQRCPICEAEKDERERGDPEEAKKMRCNMFFVCYVLDRESEGEAKAAPWVMSTFQDEDILTATKSKFSGGTIYPDNPDQGHDLSFVRKQLNARDIKTTRYSNFAFDPDPTPILDDADAQQELLDFIAENPIPNIILYYEEEYLEQIMSGTVQAVDEELDEEVGDEGEASNRGRSTRASHRDEAEAEAEAEGEEAEAATEGEDEGGDAYVEEVGDEVLEEGEGEEEEEADPEVEQVRRRPLRAGNGRASQQSRTPPRHADAPTRKPSKGRKSRGGGGGRFRD